MKKKGRIGLSASIPQNEVLKLQALMCWKALPWRWLLVLLFSGRACTCCLLAGWGYLQ